MNQVQSSPPDEDSFWIFAVSAPSGRNVRILVDSGADEHVCPTDFASAAPPGLAKGGTLYDAQGHMIEAHDTRTVYMRLGLEGQRVGAEFRVTSVKNTDRSSAWRSWSNKAAGLKRDRLGARCHVCGLGGWGVSGWWARTNKKTTDSDDNTITTRCIYLCEIKKLMIQMKLDNSMIHSFLFK